VFGRLRRTKNAGAGRLRINGMCLGMGMNLARVSSTLKEGGGRQRGAEPVQSGAARKGRIQ